MMLNSLRSSTLCVGTRSRGAGNLANQGHGGLAGRGGGEVVGGLHTHGFIITRNTRTLTLTPGR